MSTSLVFAPLINLSVPNAEANGFEVIIAAAGGAAHLAGVLAAGRTVHPRLAERADFQAFLEFVARLEKVEK